MAMSGVEGSTGAEGAAGGGGGGATGTAGGAAGRAWEKTGETTLPPVPVLERKIGKFSGPLDTGPLLPELEFVVVLLADAGAGFEIGASGAGGAAKMA